MLFDEYDITPIRLEKRNIEFPINKNITPAKFNQGFIKQVDAYFKKTKGSTDAGVVANKKAISGFLNSYGLTLETQGERIGSSTKLPAINRETGELPNIKNTLNKLDVGNLSLYTYIQPKTKSVETFVKNIKPTGGPTLGSNFANVSSQEAKKLVDFSQLGEDVKNITKDVTTSPNYQKAKSILGKTAGKVGTKLAQLDAPIVAAPFTAYSAADLASDIARGEEADVMASDITLPLAFTDMSSKALGLYNPAKTGVGSQVLRAGLSPQLASKILPKIAKGSVYATPVIETLIQAYNAKKRLEEAKRKSSVFEERVPTLLGDAPKSYLDEIMSELPEVDRMGASYGGIASLTTTVAPTRGPQHRGLASLEKRAREY